MQLKFGPLEKQHHDQQRATQQARQQDRQKHKMQSAVHKQVCREFLEKAMLPKNQDPMKRLILQKMHGNQGIGDEEQVKQHRQVAKQVSSVCNSIDYKTLDSQSCYYAIGGGRNGSQELV